MVRVLLGEERSPQILEAADDLKLFDRHRLAESHRVLLPQRLRSVSRCGSNSVFLGKRPPTRVGIRPKGVPVQAGPSCGRRQPASGIGQLNSTFSARAGGGQAHFPRNILRFLTEGALRTPREAISRSGEQARGLNDSAATVTIRCSVALAYRRHCRRRLSEVEWSRGRNCRVLMHFRRPAHCRRSRD